MQTPLNDILKNKENHLSFHTPAHNGGIVIDTRWDVTELSFSDNLLSAEGVILESEREVAKAYGVENVLFSTSGATTLIHTVVRALRRKGNFLIYGNAHKSVYNALRINGVKAHLYMGNNLKKALEESGAKVVVCTSPDYFGNTLNLKEISETARELGAILVVDSAHGSHFAFSSFLPNSATKYASLVILSQHKTMPTLTGGATLAYSDEYKKEILRSFMEIHTTSPNYLTMATIESAVKEFKERGEDLYRFVYEKVEELKTLSKDKPFNVIGSDDFSRLVIEVEGSGESVQSALEERGIYPEMVYGNKLVFIVTPYNASNLKALYEALSSINYGGMDVSFNPPKRQELIPLCFEGECEEVELTEAVGRISYREVGLYPPGVPVVASGERFSEESINFLKEHVNFTFGLEKGLALVLKQKVAKLRIEIWKSQESL